MKAKFGNMLGNIKNKTSDLKAKFDAPSAHSKAPTVAPVPPKIEAV